MTATLIFRRQLVRHKVDLFTASSERVQANWLGNWLSYTVLQCYPRLALDTRLFNVDKH